MSSISAGAPIFTPTAGKHEQLAGLHSNWQKYFVLPANSTNGVAETWGGTAAGALALPADNGMVLDRNGGLGASFGIGNTTAFLTHTTTSGTAVNGTTVRVLFPTYRKAVSIKSIGFNLLRFTSNGNTSSAYAQLTLVAKAVKTDGTTRALGTTITPNYNTGLNYYHQAYQQLILATAATIGADERLCIDITPATYHAVAGNTATNNLFAYWASTTTLQQSMWARSYEGDFSSILVEYVN